MIEATVKMSVRGVASPSDVFERLLGGALGRNSWLLENSHEL